MGKTIAIFNQKGGVAKTTTTLNLGWALINKGYTTLMIDFDPQGSLTIAMELEGNTKTIYDLLHGEDLSKVMLSDGDKFFFIPTDINLAAAEYELQSKKKGESALKMLVNAIKEDFDYILIDCPPSLGLLSINALVAANYVIVPMQTDYLAYKGYELMIDTIEQAKKYNPALDIMGILPTMHTNTNHSREMLEVIQGTGKAFKTIIGHSVKFKDATVHGIPINEYDKKMGELYVELAQEVIDYGI